MERGGGWYHRRLHSHSCITQHQARRLCEEQLAFRVSASTLTSNEGGGQEDLKCAESGQSQASTQHHAEALTNKQGVMQATNLAWPRMYFYPFHLPGLIFTPCKVYCVRVLNRKPQICRHFAKILMSALCGFPTCVFLHFPILSIFLALWHLSVHNNLLFPSHTQSSCLTAQSPVSSFICLVVLADLSSRLRIVQLEGLFENLQANVWQTSSAA